MELKKATTFDEQVESLREKNIIGADEISCKDFLSRVNYYRFSAYYLPFKNALGVCSIPIKFEKLKKIYEFDQKLRILILEIIEDIEINVRTQVAYHHVHTYGPDGYMLPNSFDKNHNHIALMKRIHACIYENRKTLVVKHHMSTYNGQFPLWVIIEFFSIGMLAHFYRELLTADQKIIAKNINNSNYQNLLSWMRCITDLRNKCAHYSRLYYTTFSAIPKMPNDTTYIPTRKLFSQLYMLKFMYTDSASWNKKFVKPLIKLTKDYHSYIDLSHLDFPYRWKSMLKK